MCITHLLFPSASSRNFSFINRTTLVIKGSAFEVECDAKYFSIKSKPKARIFCAGKCSLEENKSLQLKLDLRIFVLFAILFKKLITLVIGSLFAKITRSYEIKFLIASENVAKCAEIQENFAETFH